MTIDRNDLSLFQQVLLATDGTVTDLIALYTGEQIRVRKLEQSIRTDLAPAILRCDKPAQLLMRKILLCGTERSYLYADSIFVFERFSKSIQDQLLNTDRPIGLLWKEERLETYREIVNQQIDTSAEVANHFGIEASEALVSRTYLIHHNGKPLGSITEKWPLSYFR
jgi:chorismate-pyruvate lyase